MKMLPVLPTRRSSSKWEITNFVMSNSVTQVFTKSANKFKPFDVIIIFGLIAWTSCS